MFFFSLIFLDPVRDPVRDPICDQIRSDPGFVNAISEALLCAHNQKSQITCHRAVSPLLCHTVVYFAVSQSQVALHPCINYIMRNSDQQTELLD